MATAAEALYHPYRFAVDEYLRMGEAGILGKEDRVELIAGEIIDMPPIGIPHTSARNRVANRLLLTFGERVILSVQNPVWIGEFSLPQPDIALLRPRADYYASAHPRPEDILLLVEVAESSLPYDRDKKLPLYAAAGIAEIWLVDILGRSLTLYREPCADGYGSATPAPDLTRLSAVLLPGRTIDLGGLFGSG